MSSKRLLFTATVLAVGAALATSGSASAEPAAGPGPDVPAPAIPHVANDAATTKGNWDFGPNVDGWQGEAVSDHAVGVDMYVDSVLTTNVNFVKNPIRPGDSSAFKGKGVWFPWQGQGPGLVTIATYVKKSGPGLGFEYGPSCAIGTKVDSSGNLNVATACNDSPNGEYTAKITSPDGGAPKTNQELRVFISKK